MRGLKTQESEKFNKFFSLVQESAKRKNAVFFLEAGDGRDFKTNTLEGEDLQGWLVPIERAVEFEKEWFIDSVGDKWEQFFCFAVWSKNEQSIEINFE